MTKGYCKESECNKDFALPPCPYCGKSVHIEELGGEFRIFHMCPKTGNCLRTKYCYSPYLAADLYLDGNYEYFSGKSDTSNGYYTPVPDDNPKLPRYGILLKNNKD